MADTGIWKIDNNVPVRLVKSNITLEKDFEDWISADPSLLQDGLTIVGRQLRVPGGIIDLLALDIQGRWVVIELKRSQLRRDVLIQSIDYASSIAAMDDAELRDLLFPKLTDYGNASELKQRIEQQLELENSEGREITILIGGAGIDDGLERIIGYMERFDFPITTVSFQLFEGTEGLLLSRDIASEVDVESPVALAKGKRVGKALTLDEHFENARKLNIEQPFNALVKAAQDNGLGIRTYVRALMITPPENRTRCLMVLTPKKGKLQVYCAGSTVKEFYPDIPEKLLSEDVSGKYVALAGPELDERTFRFTDILNALDTD